MRSREESMPELHTSPSLLQALRVASARQLTAEELRKQRVSFILSAVSEKSGMTRAQVEDILAKGEGRKGP